MQAFLRGYVVPLSDTKVKNAKPRAKTYRLSDEKGMYIQVQPSGSKYWRLAYRYQGRQKTLALGVYPEVTLADAREDAFEARKLIRKKIDPSDVRKQEKIEESGGAMFGAIALDWHAKKMIGKSHRHQQRAMSILKNDLIPNIGNKRINDVKATDLLEALKKIEDRGAIDMAHRARSTAGQIFRYAIASGLCERDVSADLRGALKEKPKTEHRAAITNPEELGRLMVAIENYLGTPVVCAALKLSALLFQRPGEIRHMEWDEINWEKEAWSIPARKMKMDRDHIVPLSSQAIEVLRDVHRLTGRGRFVLPSQRGQSRPLSNNGVRTALRTLGFDADTMSAHGFRATARTLLDEKLGHRVDIIEHQLAHKVKDPTGRAYNRTAFLKERKEMMQEWADYIEGLKPFAHRDGSAEV